MNALWQSFTVWRHARRVAVLATEESWTHVRAKAVTLSPREATDYIRAHAATVVHRHVDRLVLDEPAIAGPMANQVIVRASERLAEQLAQRLLKLRQRSAKAA
jgi:hypothetical protein